MLQSGLSSEEADNRLKKYGFNDIEEKKINFFKNYILPLLSPMSLMFVGAAVLSYFNKRIFDFYFILILFFLNYFIQKIQEFKVNKSLDELKDKLNFNVLTLRDNRWVYINSKLLVPGDIIKLTLGSIIPADSKIIIARNLSINESVLTGESLPQYKKAGDKIFSGSFISTGELEAEVEATGKNTFFNKTIFSIEKTNDKSILEKDILVIVRFLIIISLVSVAILSIVFILKRDQITDILTLDLSLIIAGIPIALPTVMTIMLGIGASELSKKMVIVRRLSSLQDLANVNLLLTDKTGTLTKNEIKVVDVISYNQDYSTKDILELASYTVQNETADAIDSAIIKKLKETYHKDNKIKIIDFIPYDSDRKRSTVYIEKNKSKILISLGAPQIIESLDNFKSKELEEKFNDDIKKAAKNGYRTLALAIKNGNRKEEKMNIVGLLFLADPLYEDSKDVLDFMKKNGIDVKMVTGDNILIAKRIIKELGLSGNVLSEEETINFYKNGTLKKGYKNIAAFSEIMPKDKYELVKIFKKKYIVASTGDGVNDLPALTNANVGIAVSNAVNSLKSVADIVLLDKGLDVIKDAIIESRKIFVRIYNYSIYRISESFRLIITILILGIWQGYYPLLPIQLILLALLNDIPIISLAFDRVKISTKPSEINVKERFATSLLFGFTGICNSIILFFIMSEILHLPIGEIQTIFFLKLTVSGHALVYVAHTKEKWFKFLPSKEVIIATIATQIVATILSVTGFLMPTKISIGTAVLVWIWAFLWMQISDLMKVVQNKILKNK